MMIGTAGCILSAVDYLCGATRLKPRFILPHPPLDADQRRSRERRLTGIAGGEDLLPVRGSEKRIAGETIEIGESRQCADPCGWCAQF